MTGKVFVSTSKQNCFWMICSLVILAAFDAHATTVNYTLDNVKLADGEQIAGTFVWTYSVGDFEGGSGTFTALDIPYTTFYTFDIGNLIIEIQTSAIEISGDGSFHDAGLDISMKFVQPFTATQSASMDLGLSFFECCGNGFKDQGFQSGSIGYVVPEPSTPGDTNDDGQVNIDDLNNVRNNFGGTGPDDGTLPGDAFPFDGLVNIDDLNGVRNHFGVGVAAVPEPSALALASLLALVALVVRPQCRV